jgi:hypothetical protein
MVGLSSPGLEEFSMAVASSTCDGLVDAWSALMDKRTPDSDAETLAFFAEYLGRLSKNREDVKSLFEFGELDDYVSFGGKAYL